MARKRRKATTIVPYESLHEEQQAERRDTLKRALKATKLSQVKFAKLLEMDVRTLTRQLKGDSAIDGPAHAIYHMLLFETEATLDALDVDLMLGMDDRSLVRRRK